MNGASVGPHDLAFKGGAMRFAPDRILLPGAALFDPENPALAARPVSAGGRQAAWYVEQPHMGAAVLRHYRRGGLIARLSRDQYVWTGATRTRSFAEFDLLHFMHGQGLPVPRPLAAAYWRGGLTYRAALLTECIPHARPLAQTLDDCRPEPVAAAIRALHDAGIWHADLNVYNVLLDQTGKVWLIDFDRGRRRPMGPAQRQANLLRLQRSLVKVAGAAGARWGESLNRAYRRLMPV